MVRAAVINGALNEIPVSTTLPINERVGATIPGTDRYIGWWAPQAERDGRIYLVNIPMMRGVMLYRYPHEDEQTEEYFRGEDEEVSEEESMEEREENVLE